MTKVDPFDDSIIRHAILRHAFDPGTNHFRWIFEGAYDDKKEHGKKLQEAFDDLADRRLRGVAPLKEQVTGQVLEIGYFRNSKSRRQQRFGEGQFYVASSRNKIIFLLLTRWRPLRPSRRMEKFFRKFLSN
jgi:hypothetical protein